MSVSVKNAGLPSGLIGGAMAKIFDLMSIRVVKGQFTPALAQGVTNVVHVDNDSQAGSILLGPTESVVACLMKSTGTLTSGGSATIRLGSAVSTTSSPADATANYFCTARSYTDIIQGTQDLNAATLAVLARPYVNALLAGADLTATFPINVTLLVMNAKYPQ